MDCSPETLGLGLGGSLKSLSTFLPPFFNHLGFVENVVARDQEATSDLCVEGLVLSDHTFVNRKRRLVGNVAILSNNYHHSRPLLTLKPQRLPGDRPSVPSVPLLLHLSGARGQ